VDKFDFLMQGNLIQRENEKLATEPTAT